MGPRKRPVCDIEDGDLGAYRASDSDESLDGQTGTMGVRKRAHRDSTAKATDKRPTGRHPHHSPASSPQPQEQQWPEQVVKKDFTNLNAYIKHATASKQLRSITLPQDIQTVFPQACDVLVSYLVDGQAAEPAELLAHPLPKVRITSQQASADMRLPSGRYFKLELYKNNEAYQYVNHLITGYTAESGSTSTEPKITLHLKSPAAQQAEAAALRAEEKETGWITYAYHQARCRPRSLNACARQVCFPQGFLDRAFPGVDHRGMNLQVTVIKDNMKVENANSESRVTCWHSGGCAKARINISASAVHALAGCYLQRLKAKPPNLIQVITASASNSRQVPYCWQQPLHHESPTTDAIEAPAAAAAATPLSVAITSNASSVPPTQATISATDALTAAPGPEPLAVTAAAGMQTLSVSFGASQSQAAAAAAAATTAAQMPPGHTTLAQGGQHEMGFLNTQQSLVSNLLAADMLSSIATSRRPVLTDSGLLCGPRSDEMHGWHQQPYSDEQLLPKGIQPGYGATLDTVSIMTALPAPVCFGMPDNIKPLDVAAHAIVPSTCGDVSMSAAVAAVVPTPAALNITASAAQATAMLPLAAATTTTAAMTTAAAPAAVCPFPTVRTPVAMETTAFSTQAVCPPAVVTAATAAVTSAAGCPVSAGYTQTAGVGPMLPVLQALPVQVSPLVQHPLHAQPTKQDVQQVTTTVKPGVPVIVTDSDSGDGDEQHSEPPNCPNRQQIQLQVVPVKPERHQQNCARGVQRSKYQHHRISVKIERCKAGPALETVGSKEAASNASPGAACAPLSDAVLVADSVTLKAPTTALVVQADSKRDRAEVQPIPAVDADPSMVRASRGASCQPITASEPPTATLAAVNLAATNLAVADSPKSLKPTAAPCVPDARAPVQPPLTEAAALDVTHAQAAASPIALQLAAVTAIAAGHAVPVTAATSTIDPKSALVVACSHMVDDNKHLYNTTDVGKKVRTTCAGKLSTVKAEQPQPQAAAQQALLGQTNQKGVLDSNLECLGACRLQQLPDLPVAHTSRKAADETAMTTVATGATTFPPLPTTPTCEAKFITPASAPEKPAGLPGMHVALQGGVAADLSCLEAQALSDMHPTTWTTVKGVIVIDSDMSLYSDDQQTHVHLRDRQQQVQHLQQQPVLIQQEQQLNTTASGQERQCALQPLQPNWQFKSSTAEPKARSSNHGAGDASSDVLVLQRTATAAVGTCTPQQHEALGTTAEAATVVQDSQQEAGFRGAAQAPYTATDNKAQSDSSIRVELQVQPATSPGPTTTAVVATAVNIQDEQKLPACCTLTDCGDDVLAAGRQLTRLLRNLQAPDQQVLQLNAGINKLRSSQADQAWLRDFWYDFDQLQLWVERRNVDQCRSALHQLLRNLH